MALTTQSEDATEVNEWITFGMRVAASTALHPFEYAKVLIQLGYEPIAPRPGKSLFGKPVLVLPNVFQYVKYIKSVDGFIGCYRGVGPKIVGSIVSAIASEKVAAKLGYDRIADDSRSDMDESTDEELNQRFFQRLRHDLIVTISAVTLSHPFHMISVRMMAQFIGNETTYKSLWASIKEIWNTEGILGFFSGYTPRVICEASCLIMATSATYLLRKHLIRDKDGHQYVGTFTNFIVGTIFYPLHVVSTCMKVSGSRIMAGQPPLMPKYNNWYHCLKELQASGEHKRGSSLFFRYYRAQPMFRNDILLPKMKTF